MWKYLNNRLQINILNLTLFYKSFDTRCRTILGIMDSQNIQLLFDSYSVFVIITD